MPFAVLALTPPSLFDPSIAIAACRAGAVGVLDLEHARDASVAVDALAALTRLAHTPSGVRLGVDDLAISRAMLRALPDLVRTVIVAPSALGELSAELSALRGRGVRVLAEVTDAALVADDLPIDGLVARGLEAGGWVGDETTFILLQRLLQRTRLPIWAHGGIGLHTVAACRVAGLAGVVLDSQLALLRESALPEHAKAAVTRMDGSETACLGGELGAPFRVYTRPGLAALDELRRLATMLAGDSRPLTHRVSEWRAAVRARVGWGEGQLWPLGQDAAFAGDLARQFVTVGGVVAGMADAARAHVQAAGRLQPLAEHSPLARSHGTRYPIMQGPMTRVSDTAAFARSVAEAGALPFLALALLRGPEVRTLLTETSQGLGARPWGVGILGFVPFELRQEQLEVIREVRPPFALVAGGRPDQALALEQVGIPTYLHVPSPALLRLFIEGGARRFVFEGRECGGHVGPRSSFVLWNSMIDVLLDCVPPGEMAASCHVVFAGGIHDAASAAMVAAMAAPLAERGIKIGVLLGTAYIFTEEAVRDGAIAPAFQEEAVRCSRTALLETGPGHATRCLTTPFVETFVQERRRLEEAGRTPEEIRDALEDLNLGRLRIASKGIARQPRAAEVGATRFVALSPEEQRRQGMYMIGQVAALRDSVGTIAALHREVAVGGTERLGAPEPESADPVAAARPCDVAIIGMACVMPKAPGLEAYWSNIVNKVDAITEIPPDRFDWRRYYDPDPLARDKIYSKWGGFIDPVPFDPARYGMPPNSLPSIEPLQLLTLEVVRRGLEDAGYASRPFARERTGVIVGVGGGVAELGQRYAFRAGLPMHVPDAPPDTVDALPEWTEDSFAGIILNVAAGRVANRLDLGGVNYTVDAACASSLAAIYAGVRELEAGTADTMIVAGADTVQSPFGYLCFAKTRALSPHGRCRTFDESADGIVISEGIAVVVLKRLADAERDGDRIYAVIKAVAGSSDGRDRSMTAPRPEGQMLALRRAYATAGVSPATVELIEAHGTGTVAGDQAEIEALTRVFGEASAAARQWCAVGSVKSMIGHTKCAAGLAGLIKVSKALHHKVLPPTLGVERPNSKARFAEGPFYVNSEARPWLRPTDEPRRAGVSAFGFGGTNFHVVVEEYTGAVPSAAVPATLHEWPAELFLFTGRTTAELGAAVKALSADIGAAPAPLRRLAASAWARARAGRAGLDGPSLTVAVVASSIDDLRAKMAALEARLAEGAGAIEDPRGIYFTESPLAREGSVAFLFPGQGSQYPDMLRDLAMSFSEVRDCIEAASGQLAGRFPKPLATYIFPPPRFTPEAERACEEALKETNIAQPSLGAAGLGMFRLLSALGVRPGAMAGHSYGEYVALCAAGSLSESSLYGLSEARGRAIIEAAGPMLGTMAAVQAGPDAVRAALDGGPDVWIANVNSPRQVVISGTSAGIATAIERLAAAGLAARRVAVACAFHSPLLAEAGLRFAEHVAKVDFAPPSIPVFSNAAAAPYDDDPARIARSLAAHMTQPVRFMDEVEAMYAAGCRLFVEVGPRNILTPLVQQTFEGRRVRAVATDVPGRPGLMQLLHALGQLAAHGVAISLDPLFAGRLEGAEAAPAPSPTTWLVSGGAARPAGRTSGPSAGPAPSAKTATALPPPPRHTAPPVVTGVPSSGPVLPLLIDPRPAAAPAPTAMVPGAGSDVGETVSEVMVQFQRTMSKFLETQRNVMLAYLGAGGDVTGPGDGSPLLGLTVAEPMTGEGAGDAGDRAALAHVHAGGDVTGPGGLTEPPAVVSPEVVVDRAWLAQELLRVVSERTGYPAEMLALDANMEADLGIDSIKRIEILGGLRQALPAAMGAQVQGALETLTQARTLAAIVEAVGQLLAGAEQASAAPAAAAAPAVAVDRAWLAQELLRVVSERTGYPAEMLALDANMEADLGIDSIKRIEILGGLRQALPAAMGAQVQGALETLTQARTLGAIVEMLTGLLAEDQAYPPRVTAAPVPEAPSPQAPLVQATEETVPRFVVGDFPLLNGAPVRVTAQGDA